MYYGKDQYETATTTPSEVMSDDAVNMKLRHGHIPNRKGTKE